MANSADGRVNGAAYFQPARTSVSGTSQPQRFEHLGQNLLTAGTTFGTSRPQRLSALQQFTDVASKVIQNQRNESLQEQRQAEVLKGMQAAALGQTIQDIAEEQPWYTKIFGKADAVTGAEMYIRDTQAKSVIADIYGSIQDLDNKTPDQARQAIQARIQKGLTGVPAVDTQIFMQMQGHLPELMKTQAKRHFAWQQENLAAQQQGNMRASLNLLGGYFQQYLADPNSDSGKRAVLAMSQTFRESLIPLPGQQEDVWKKNVTEGVLAELHSSVVPRTDVLEDGSTVTRQGSLHIARLLQSPEVLTKLPQDMQERFRSEALKAEQSFMASYQGPAWRRYISYKDKMRDPAQYYTRAAAIKEAHDINEQFRKETGLTSEFIDTKELTGDLQQLGAAITRMRERQAEIALRNAELLKKKADSADAGKIDVDRVVNTIDQFPYLRELGLQTGPDQKRDASRTYNALKVEANNQKLPPEQRALAQAKLDKLLTSTQEVIGYQKAEYRERFNAIVRDPQNATRNPKLLDDMTKQYARDKALMQPSAFIETYSDEMHTKLGGYLSTVELGTDPAAAAAYALALDTEQYDAGSKELIKPLTELTKARSDKWSITAALSFAENKTPYDAAGYSDEGLKAIMPEISSRVQRLERLTGSSREVALREAWAQVQQNTDDSGFEVHGSLIMRKIPGAPPISQHLTRGKDALPVDTLAEQLQEYIDYIANPQGTAAVRSSYSGDSKAIKRAQELLAPFGKNYQGMHSITPVVTTIGDTPVLMFKGILTETGNSYILYRTPDEIKRDLARLNGR